MPSYSVVDVERPGRPDKGVSEGAEVMVEGSLCVFAGVAAEVVGGVVDGEASAEVVAVDIVERLGRLLGAA